MESSKTGPCEAILWELHRSNLVDGAQLDRLAADLFQQNPAAGPDELTARLVEFGYLTAFQAERLLAGKGQELILNNYLLIDVLGQGSMGTVFKAHNTTDGQLYAVKLLPRRSMWNVRLARRLVRALEGFRDPSYAAFVDVGTAGNTHMLAWELAEGEPLSARVQRLGRLLPGIAALYCMHVAQGISLFDKQNVVHGIIKPTNIMIAEGHQARILDFGIGALLSESKEESLVDTMSTANTVTTGLDFRSPETIIEPTLRTAAGDQYSLGCVLYFCLTGQNPFPEGNAVQKMMAHQAQEPTPVRKVAPSTPKRLALVVERMMKKNPDDRFPTPEAVIEALLPLAVSPEMAERLIVSNALPEPVESSAEFFLNQQEMSRLQGKSSAPSNGAEPATPQYSAPAARSDYRPDPVVDYPTRPARPAAPRYTPEPAAPRHAPERAAPRHTPEPAAPRYTPEPAAEPEYAQPVSDYAAAPASDFAPSPYVTKPVSTMPKRRPAAARMRARPRPQAAPTSRLPLLLMGALGFIVGFGVVAAIFWLLLRLRS
jgi:serine/threonine-protein kinase